MTFSITPLTRSQLLKVLKVAVYVCASQLVAVAIAYLSKNPQVVVIAPAINVLLVTIAKVFQTGEQSAISDLPDTIKPEVQTVINALPNQSNGAQTNEPNPPQQV